MTPSTMHRNRHNTEKKKIDGDLLTWPSSPRTTSTSSLASSSEVDQIQDAAQISCQFSDDEWDFFDDKEKESKQSDDSWTGYSDRSGRKKTCSRSSRGRMSRRSPVRSPNRRAIRTPNRSPVRSPVRQRFVDSNHETASSTNGSDEERQKPRRPSSRRRSTSRRLTHHHHRHHHHHALHPHSHHHQNQNHHHEDQEKEDSKPAKEQSQESHDNAPHGAQIKTTKSTSQDEGLLKNLKLREQLKHQKSVRPVGARKCRRPSGRQSFNSISMESIFHEADGSGNSLNDSHHSTDSGFKAIDETETAPLVPKVRRRLHRGAATRALRSNSMERLLKLDGLEDLVGPPSTDEDHFFVTKPSPSTSLTTTPSEEDQFSVTKPSPSISMTVQTRLDGTKFAVNRESIRQQRRGSMERRSKIDASLSKYLNPVDGESNPTSEDLVGGRDFYNGRKLRPIRA